MVEQALEVSSAISPQAGPGEVENHILSDANMRRVTQAIGRQLAQIGDELNSRWREKLPQQRHLDWQVYPNVLIWRAINRRITGILQWSTFMPMVRLVPELHAQACQTTMKWINWVKPHFPDWSSKTKCFLASAALLVAATVFTATRI
ncbi:bcl-2-interacting killer isoform 1-T1 [Clarias gariepinus]|uniref:bcl-2-interacting killer isoform X1 n=1 Tax=Clarias gariepinus TaxID=13013 RepID=UPI00234CD5D4|nr:bcl-2-interacting killer isoform X1 [Clarias gariepinus]